MTALLFAVLLSAGEEPDRVVAYKTVETRDLHLEVFLPDGEATGRPAVLFFHGGGWKNGTPRQFRPHCRFLADRGVVAATAEYRLASTDGAKAVDCVADAWDAVRDLRSRADELGLDASRVAVGGGSAGGHLAACLGTGTYPPEAGRADDPRPAAMMLFNPAVCLAPYEAGGVAYEPKGFERGAGLDRVGCEPAALSPLHHVDAATPPVVAYHGTADTTVDIESVRLFVRAVEAEPSILHAYDGRGHGFFNPARAKDGDFEDTLRRTEAFLAALGWIKD